MSGLLLFIGGFVMGWIFVEHYVKMTMKKLHKTDLDNAYHAGFEKGVEKGRNDYEAELRSFAQATQEEENEFAKRMESLGYSISLETTDHQHSESCGHATGASTYATSGYLSPSDTSNFFELSPFESKEKKKSPKKPVKKKIFSNGKKKANSRKR